MTSCFTGIRAGAVILSFCHDGNWTWPEIKEKIYMKLSFEQCFGSGMFIPDRDPDFYPSRIPGLEFRIPGLGFRITNSTTAKKKKGEKFLVLPFTIATNIKKLKIISYLNW
jgi:hypothetical protein